jgi:hypothetical protein
VRKKTMTTKKEFDSDSEYSFSSSGEEYERDYDNKRDNTSGKGDKDVENRTKTMTQRAEKDKPTDIGILAKIDTRRQKNKRTHSLVTYVFHNSGRGQKSWIDLVKASLTHEQGLINLEPLEVLETKQHSQNPITSRNVFISATVSIANNFKGYPLVCEFVDFGRKSDIKGPKFSGSHGKIFYCFEQQMSTGTVWAPYSDTVNHDELYVFMSTSGGFIGTETLKLGIKNVGKSSFVKAEQVDGKYTQFHPVLLILEEEKLKSGNCNIDQRFKDGYVEVDKDQCKDALKKLEEFWKDLIVFKGDRIKVNIYCAIPREKADEVIKQYNSLYKQVEANKIQLSEAQKATWDRYNEIPKIEIKAEINCLPQTSDTKANSDSDSEDSSDDEDPRIKPANVSGKIKDEAKAVLHKIKKHHHHKKHRDGDMYSRKGKRLRKESNGQYLKSKDYDRNWKESDRTFRGDDEWNDRPVM